MTLVISDDSDIIEKSESNSILTFKLIDCKFSEVAKFKEKTGFVLLNYICDTMMPEFVIGVNRLTDCIVFDINESKNTLCIECRGGKEYFNMGNKAEIRKIKISSLLDDGDDIS
jgi:hypothetical protein